MSDTKLRELEMEWKAEAGNFAHEGGIAVAYLAELLRAGQVRHFDCVLAWRQHRIEELLRVPDGMPRSGPAAARFDPEHPVMAVGVLMVLFADDPHLNPTPHLTRCIPGGHTGPINYDGNEPVCERCGEALPPAPAHPPGVLPGRNPFFSPPALQYVTRACRPEAHLGPINFDADPPRCQRCGKVVG